MGLFVGPQMEMEGFLIPTALKIKKSLCAFKKGLEAELAEKELFNSRLSRGTQLGHRRD